ncbi:sulfotransferase [soil metagenome]
MAGHLPNFLLIGAMRSGTSSLARWLRGHPEIFLAVPKELHYFDREHERGVAWYQERFADVADETAVGEATPSYLYRVDAVERMAALVPDARLLVILREPVERAYSHYWLERQRGREPRSFAAAMAAEQGGRPEVPGRLAYLDRSRYLPQLERLCRHYPRSAVHVALFDDLVDQPAAAFAAVCRFLGVDDAVIPSEVGSAVNASVSFRSLRVRRLVKDLPGPLRRVADRLNTHRFAYPPIDRGLAAQLRASLADDNRSLAQWLGRDLSAWST